MRAISPRTGAPEAALAEDQLEYATLPFAVYRDSRYGGHQYLTRWTFTPEERAAIAAGEDLYLAELIYPGHQFTPVQLCVGPQHWTVPDATNAG